VAEGVKGGKRQEVNVVKEAQKVIRWLDIHVESKEDSDRKKVRKIRKKDSDRKKVRKIGKIRKKERH